MALTNKLTNSKALVSFSYNDFKWLWIGSFASWTALNMQMITRGWLILRVTDDSPLALTLVTLFFALPMTVISPFSGALADRFSRSKIVVTSQIANAFVILILALLDYIGIVAYWHILGIAMANGILMALNMPSRQAMVSDIVPDEKLMNAISLTNSSNNLSRAFGPAIAGLLIVLLGTSGTLFIISAIYIVAGLTISKIKTRPNKLTPKNTSVITDILDGLKYAFGNAYLKSLFIMIFASVMFGFSYFILIPAWARESLQIEADGLGVLLMVIGIGATAGTLMLAVMGNPKYKGRILIVSALSWGTSLAIFAQITSFYIALPFLFILGFSSASLMSLTMTLIQIKSSSEMRGRTQGIAMMTFGLMPLSAVPFGTLAEHIGTADALTISGILLTIFTLVYVAISKTFRNLE
jgi:MFS family permease